jgi:hypothetical protein
LVVTAWSQAGQSGGAGTAGGTGTAGGAGTAGPGNAPGGAGPANVPGAAGPANTPGAAGPANSPNAAGVGAPGVPPNANIGANPQSQGAGANPASQAPGARTVPRSKVGNNPRPQDRNSIGTVNDPSNFYLNNNPSQNPFFNDPGVRRQLNLNDNQFNALNRAYQNAYARYNRSLQGLGQNLTPQQRQMQMQNFNNQFYDEFGRTVDSTFTDPRLRARYEQLRTQQMGFSAFNNPQIQRQFNLTPQQMVQIRQMASVWREQLNRMRGQDGVVNYNNIDPQQWSTMYNQYWDQINGVLTPEQQQMWRQLTGERYNFSPQYYGLDNDSYNVEGQYSDGTTPVNPSGQIYGSGLQLKQGEAQPRQGSQTPSGSSQTPRGNTANSDSQGGSVR